MPHKRTKFKEEDFDKIAEIINHQLTKTEINYPEDKETEQMMKFVRTVICRNIAEYLAEYFSEILADSVEFNYYRFLEDAMKD